PIPVRSAAIDRGRVERTVANTRAGTVNACRRARLAPPSGGAIAALPVREGDRVQAGQVLLELWNEDTAAQARVAVEQSRSAVLRAEEVCVSAATAAREADRARKLHGDGLLPDEQVDRAISSATTLRAACNAARADVQQGEARVAAARATLTRTVLRAPFAGVVAKITGEVGEFTTPSPPGIPTPPAVDLIDDSCLYVSAPIDEVDVARVRVGQPAYITIDALPGQRFAGRVRRVAPYVVDLEKQARTVDVEVEFLNPQDAKALLAGYSADAEVVLDVRENVVRVPTQALLEGNRVLVISDDTLHERRLQTGLANWQYTEVLSGLEPGDAIVLSVERKGLIPGARIVLEK
ncbi:MAG TPA: efflux RND transporter periplasmic adaptor subunit, partial [Thermoanaerobaculia bacterium]|nr:efflux RND transporter periplasmic adaptor subunit [Thermoanaerobaculia bacterium]